MLEHGKIGQIFENRDKLKDELQAEVNMYHRATNLKKELESAYARQIIRSSFSFIEAMLFQAKYVAYQIALDLKYDFTKRENEFFEEVQLQIDNENDEKVKWYPPLYKNVMFIFAFCPKLGDFEYNLDTQSENWEQFLSAIQIRHRITHPKDISDVIISQDDFRIVREARQWWIDELDKMTYEFQMAVVKFYL